ncbi:MAG TPA: NAD(+)/NADH kinase [Thermoanaerobaculia bacterium]|nr:NAD(+)/NADH kinase [Thermoanaerobaculia bacterium]
MKRVAISAKVSSPDALTYVAEVVSGLISRGLEVVVDEHTAAALETGSAPVYPKEHLGANADLLITFGGDGTLLSVARHAPRNVPIIGVNMGTLGFLTEIRLEQFPAVLDQVLSGNYQTEPRVCFDVTVDSNSRKRYRVLNDAVINKGALARIVEMRVEVSNHFVSTFRADGLIVSTPTGSTAYNLSAGGPIVYPTMGAIIITPICPHMLTNRPIVLPDDLTIKISIIAEHKETFLTLDGQEGVSINQGDTVTIQKSSDTILFVQSPDKDYFDVLRKKLRWGEGT